MALVDEPIANESCETLDDLEEVLFERCQSLLGVEVARLLWGAGL